MASRQEEKEKRRQERMAVEAQAASAKARTRRIQAALAAILVIGVVVGGVLALTGGSDDGGVGEPTVPGDTTAATIPPAQEKDLAKAAKAADCVLVNPPIQGRSHTTEKVAYRSQPPTSGDHNPEPALDGIYNPGQTPEPEHYVHSLEHGRIEFQYKPGTPANEIAQLETLFSEELNGKAGYKTLLFENNTKMTYAVAATAWGHLIGCPKFSDSIFDALRDFRVKWVDQGPEIIPPTN